MNKNIFAVLALSILINNAPASAAETQKLPGPGSSAAANR